MLGKRVSTESTLPRKGLAIRMLEKKKMKERWNLEQRNIVQKLGNPNKAYI